MTLNNGYIGYWLFLLDVRFEKKKNSEIVISGLKKPHYLQYLKYSNVKLTKAPAIFELEACGSVV